MGANRKRLLLIDGNNYLARAYYATPKLSSPTGEPTNAVRGFINILLADLMKLRPTHVGITFDKGGKPNWRKSVYPEYKANRRAVFDKTDKKSLEKRRKIEEMRAQEPLLKAILRAMGLRVINKAGVEADDLLGTLSTQYAAKGYEVIIATNDKDMAQLVGAVSGPGGIGDIRIMTPSRELCGQLEIYRDYGVKPSQIIDYLCMIGDSVDNIRGIDGVGSKTAAKLLGEYGSLKKVIASADELSPALAKKVKAAKKHLKITKQIITIKLDEPHKVKTSQLVFPNEAYDPEEVKRLCVQYGFKKTHTQIADVISKWNNNTTQKSKPGGLW